MELNSVAYKYAVFLYPLKTSVRIYTSEKYMAIYKFLSEVYFRHNAAPE